MRSDLPFRALTGVVNAFNRNPVSSRKLRLLSETEIAEDMAMSWSQDGLRTRHVPAFQDDPRFVKAHARAIQAAGGVDYGIAWRVHTLLWAAGLAEPVPGDFVECGTARGYMASAVCDYLDWSTRPFFLFDTFEQSARPESAHFYANGADAVRQNFESYSGVELVVGRVPDTLSSVAIERVALLHVDMNAAEPEEAAIRHFWPMLSPGGVMVLDDYGFESYPESRASAKRLAVELGFEIYGPPTGQGIVIKPR